MIGSKVRNFLLQTLTPHLHLYHKKAFLLNEFLQRNRCKESLDRSTLLQVYNHHVRKDRFSHVFE